MSSPKRPLLTLFFAIIGGVLFSFGGSYVISPVIGGVPLAIFLYSAGRLFSFIVIYILPLMISYVIYILYAAVFEKRSINRFLYVRMVLIFPTMLAVSLPFVDYLFFANPFVPFTEFSGRFISMSTGLLFLFFSIGFIVTILLLSAGTVNTIRERFDA